MLQVERRDSSSVRLSLNETPATDYGQIECNSLSSEERNHTVIVHLKDNDISVLFNSTLEVKPLLPSTQYECCFESDTACLTFGTAHAPLSAAEAGAVGSVVGIVVTLLLTAVIVGVLFGALVLSRRRRAIKRSRNRPVLRTNSKIYKRDDADQRSNMSPESIVEDTLKPLSLPSTKPRPQPPKKHPPYQPKGPPPPQLNSKSKGPVPLAPSTNSHQGNYYSSQNKDPGPIEDSFEDSFDDDDDFAEPEETYETMLSTANNVAYKNRAPAPRVQRKTRQKPHQEPPPPEEYYDYLPG